MKNISFNSCNSTLNAALFYINSTSIFSLENISISNSYAFNTGAFI